VKSIGATVQIVAMAAVKKPNLDSVTTINDDGSRYFLHPADVNGKWVLARRVVGIC
jgi:hypothetical protein